MPCKKSDNWSWNFYMKFVIMLLASPDIFINTHKSTGKGKYSSLQVNVNFVCILLHLMYSSHSSTCTGYMQPAYKTTKTQVTFWETQYSYMLPNTLQIQSLQNTSTDLLQSQGNKTTYVLYKSMNICMQSPYITWNL